MKFIAAAASAAFLGIAGVAGSMAIASPIDGQANPRVAAANNAAAGQAADRSDIQAAGNADVQAGYAADMAAYRQALRRNHRIANRDARIYDHQQRAYADAMADWRHQVYACKHGSTRACNAPTPDPASYW